MSQLSSDDKAHLLQIKQAANALKLVMGNNPKLSQSSLNSAVSEVDWAVDRIEAALNDLALSRHKLTN